MTKISGTKKNKHNLKDVLKARPSENSICLAKYTLIGCLLNSSHNDSSSDWTSYHSLVLVHCLKCLQVLLHLVFVHITGWLANSFCTTAVPCQNKHKRCNIKTTVVGLLQRLTLFHSSSTSECFPKEEFLYLLLAVSSSSRSLDKITIM